MNRRKIGFVGAIILLLSSTLVALPKSLDIQIDKVESDSFKISSLDKIEQVQEFRRVQKPQVVRKEVAEEEIIEEIVKKEIVVEEKQVTYDNKEYWNFEISYYCSCAVCCGVETGITASGNRVQEGITIAMPSEIPFGTQVYIDGLGTYTTQDRGGYIKSVGNNTMRVDIYVSSHQKALELGRHNGTGYIIRK